MSLTDATQPPTYIPRPLHIARPNDEEYFAGPNERTVPNDVDPVDLNYNHLEIIQNVLQSQIMRLIDKLGSEGAAESLVGKSCIKTLRYLIDATGINALQDHDNDEPEVTTLLIIDQVAEAPDHA